MKTKAELTALKKEVADLNRKLAELSDDELETVTGGWGQGTVSQILFMIDLLSFVDNNRAQWGCKTAEFFALLKKNPSCSQLYDYLIFNRGCGDSFIDRIYREYFDKD